MSNDKDFKINLGLDGLVNTKSKSDFNELEKDKNFTEIIKLTESKLDDPENQLWWIRANFFSKKIPSNILIGSLESLKNKIALEKDRKLFELLNNTKTEISDDLKGDKKNKFSKSLDIKLTDKVKVDEPSKETSLKAPNPISDENDEIETELTKSEKFIFLVPLTLGLFLLLALGSLLYFFFFRNQSSKTIEEKIANSIEIEKNKKIKKVEEILDEDKIQIDPIKNDAKESREDKLSSILNDLDKKLEEASLEETNSQIVSETTQVEQRKTEIDLSQPKEPDFVSEALNKPPKAELPKTEIPLGPKTQLKKKNSQKRKFVKKKIYVISKYTKVYSLPASASTILTELKPGSEVKIAEELGNWLKIVSNRNRAGYIRKGDLSY